MGKIKVLDKLIADKIAAGEVVERPSSVVKELVENSLDAKSGRITIEIKDGGKEFIRITDDGIGMDREDAELCVLRHATSKIKSADDLFDIKTMGFRGEALASICAVSCVILMTKKEDSDIGTKIVIKGGEVIETSDVGCPKGTTITVENLFFNTPARLNFLKKSSTEAAYIEELISKLILANPEISIRFIKDGKEALYSKGDGDLKSAIYSIYGAEISKNLIKVENTLNGVKISGYAGNPNIAKPSYKFQTFCVNKRICRTKIMISALEFAYFQKMAQGKHPFCVLNIEINPFLCDVNVHPQKAEVKFSDETQIYNAILFSVKNALDSELFIKKTSVITPKREIPEYIEKSEKTEKKEVKENKQPETKKTQDYVQKSFASFDNSKKSFSTFKKAPSNLFLKEKETPYGKEVKKEKKEEDDDFLPEIILPKKEDKPKPEIKEENISEDYKIIGQIFSTYIIIEKDDQMLLLDQHAAHERMNYEMLKEAYTKKEVGAQYLLIPKKISLSPSEHTIVLDNAKIFSELGIEIEDFDGRSVTINSIPLDVKENQLEKLIYEIIAEIKKKGKMDKEDFNQKLLYLVSCKMSIKANMTLSSNEMEELVKKAFLLNGKTTCPHGRPLFISFDKITIENKFER